MKDVLKYLRRTGGFTQADAARMLGVSRQSYSKYESGAVVPSDELVAKASEVYGVDESFIRANRVPSISGSKVEYKIGCDADVPEVAAPECDFTADSSPFRTFSITLGLITSPFSSVARGEAFTAS